MPPTRAISASRAGARLPPSGAASAGSQAAVDLRHVRRSRYPLRIPVWAAGYRSEGRHASGYDPAQNECEPNEAADASAPDSHGRPGGLRQSVAGSAAVVAVAGTKLETTEVPGGRKLPAHEATRVVACAARSRFGRSPFIGREVRTGTLVGLVRPN